MSSHRNRRTQQPIYSPAADRHAIVDAVTQLVNLLNDSAVSTHHTVKSLQPEVIMPVTKLSASSLPGYIGVSFTNNKVAVVVAASVDLQAVAGNDKKSLSQVVATAPHDTQLLVQGVSRGEGLDWLLVQYTTARSTVNGWVPIADANGRRLLAPAAVATAIHVRRPLADRWVLSQGWGAWPELYRQITYDGVPLKGHNGLDFAAPVGTPIVATDAGVVKRVDFEAGGFGNFVLLEHTWGESLYAHLAEVQVRPQIHVTAGQTLALSGKTGRCYGAHLHFGIRLFPYRRTDGWGGFCDPTPFLEPATAGAPHAIVGQLDQLALELPGYQRP